VTAVLLITCLMTQPGSGTVWGTVTNAADSQAVAGATVNLWRNDSCVALVTDSLGGFRASVPAGHYIVIASASGGRHAGHEVDVQTGQEVFLDLRVAAQKPRPLVPVESLYGVANPPTELPIGIHIRLYEHGGDLMNVERMLAITQVDESVMVQSIGPRPAHRFREPTWGGPGMTEGLVPFAEFLVFWDSLNHLGFRHLKDEYSGKARMLGEMSGYLSVSSEKSDREKVSKTVRFYVPGACPPEFGRVYDLTWSMARFAVSAPDSLKDTH
jgi:hypothetical protein